MPRPLYSSGDPIDDDSPYRGGRTLDSVNASSESGQTDNSNEEETVADNGCNEQVRQTRMESGLGRGSQMFSRSNVNSKPALAIGQFANNRQRLPVVSISSCQDLGTDKLNIESKVSTRNCALNNECLRQCLGLGCTKPASGPMTKYCSRMCGLSVALRRMDRLLREGRAAWYSKDSNSLDSAADKRYKLRLKEVRFELLEIHHRLIEMENQHQQLNALISRGRNSKSSLMEEDLVTSTLSDLEEADQMEPTICMTCLSEVNMRHALRHLEKCFQKMESSSLLCSSQKEQSQGTPLFCDTYDSHAKAFCKRLRVVCEHSKECNYPPDTICAFPLVQNVFTATGTFCSTPRSKCTRHFGWERKARAKIDLERYRFLARMDELFHEEARIKCSLLQRGGVLAIMLHRTIDESKSSKKL